MAVVALASSCSSETDTSVQARLEAYYQSPPDEARAGCLAAAVVRLANESGVDPGPLADGLTRTSSGSDPTLTQAQARVVADAFVSCPLPPADGSTTTTTPTVAATDAPAEAPAAAPTAPPTVLPGAPTSLP